MSRNSGAWGAVPLLEYSFPVHYHGSGYVCVCFVSNVEGWTVCLHQDGGVATEPVSGMGLLQAI